MRGREGRVSWAVCITYLGCGAICRGKLHYLQDTTEMKDRNERGGGGGDRERVRASFWTV